MYKVLTHLSIQIPPFVYKKEASNGTNGPKYYGYCIQLLDDLAHEMDFDYDIYDSPDGLFGSMAEDGSWSGLINELIHKVHTLCSTATLLSESFPVNCTWPTCR